MIILIVLLTRAVGRIKSRGLEENDSSSPVSCRTALRSGRPGVARIICPRNKILLRLHVHFSARVLFLQVIDLLFLRIMLFMCYLLWIAWSLVAWMPRVGGSVPAPQLNGYGFALSLPVKFAFLPPLALKVYMSRTSRLPCPMYTYAFVTVKGPFILLTLTNNCKYNGIIPI